PGRVRRLRRPRAPAARLSEIPQPEDIYRHTKEEGERRLERPLLEMISTALAAGFDIVAGITALALVMTEVEPWVRKNAAHVFGGLIIILILTTEGVLPIGTASTLAENADTIHAHGTLSLFMSAVFAGALITAMTWFVEGQLSMLVRVVVAWIAGALLALGSFNHVIVITLALIFGYRYGAHFDWAFIAGNFGIAAAGNIV